MTPKEKAEELINSFKHYAYYPKTNDDDVFVEKLNQNAKHCALICVDEIIKSDPINPRKNSPFEVTHQMVKEAVNYWKEVANEIAKHKHL